MAKNVIRLQAVRERTKLSRTTIHRKEKAGIFPRRVILGPNSVGWIEDEIEAWLENLPRAGQRASKRSA